MPKPAISLIITIRGREPLLGRTIELARQNAGAPVEIVLVFDGPPHSDFGARLAASGTDAAGDLVFSGLDADAVHVLRTPRGCMAARHAGILRSTGRLIVTLDAHMGLPPDWARQVARFFQPRERAKTIACACMVSADEVLAPLLGDPAAGAGDPAARCYRGARIAWKTIEPVAGHATAIEPAILGAKWCAANQPGQAIGCIMGAFYCFHRAWYNALGEPWQVGTGWGGDEELLSIASCIRGGEVRLLPERLLVTHRMGHDMRGRWSPTNADIHGIWLNRFRLPWIMPLEDAERAELLEHIADNAHTCLNPHWAPALAADRARPEVEALRKLYAPHTAAWRVYRNTYIDRPPVDQVAPLRQRAAARAALLASPPPLSPPLPTPNQEPRTPNQEPRTKNQEPLPPNHEPRTTNHEPRTTNPSPHPAPQILRPLPVDVCDLCDARQSFRVENSRRSAAYLKCQHCGRRAVRRRDGSLRFGIEVNSNA